MLDESFYEDIESVELLDICLYLSQLLLISFFPSFEASCIDQSYMSNLLIFFIDLIPFSPKTIT